MLAALLEVSGPAGARADPSEMIATHYGSTYDGLPMGCGGVYWGGDASILAVGPAHYADWPCGTRLRVTGPAGTAIVTRQDSCPGCSSRMIDLSESANAAVCGWPPSTCNVLIEEIP